MNAFSSNPFVLPGMGQSGDAASNPLLASMEMMRKAFTSLTGPGGLNAGLQMTRAMDPDELEKKIADLRAVENWLKLNLSMLSSTIQGMEVQLATIVTLKSYMPGMTGETGTTNAASASNAPKSIWPETTATAASAKEEVRPSAASSKADDSSSTSEGASKVTEAAQAWWDMLQRQFGQVAQATAATMAASTAAVQPATKATNSRSTKTVTKTAATKKASPAKKATARAPRKAAI